MAPEVLGALARLLRERWVAPPTPAMVVYALKALDMLFRHPRNVAVVAELGGARALAELLAARGPAIRGPGGTGDNGVARLEPQSCLDALRCARAITGFKYREAASDMVRTEDCVRALLASLADPSSLHRRAVGGVLWNMTDHGLLGPGVVSVSAARLYAPKGTRYVPPDPATADAGQVYRLTVGVAGSPTWEAAALPVVRAMCRGSPAVAPRLAAAGVVSLLTRIAARALARGAPELCVRARTRTRARASRARRSWALEFASASLGDLFAHEPRDEEQCAPPSTAAAAPTGPRRVDLSKRVVIAKASRLFTVGTRAAPHARRAARIQCARAGRGRGGGHTRAQAWTPFL